MDYSLLIFNSSRHAIKAESLCRKNGIKVIVIATPEYISAECGMSLKIENSSVDVVVKLLDDAIPNSYRLHS